ncbi:MAG: disulfide bond formation protein DsbA [Rhodobacteraceae bacterium]|nr:disulfide bond formation protein DsbA [Paracoccaceae bacterium]MBR25391.1 disulfide bond formation protein DsbA [Paracoccaceae bacterium]MBR29463.1 disulfide bond formation protein DsbA [Paracoccaceae bacterium]|tara:strand:- start:9 stop:605 length:597 start_codon:yes stop_codon:yes gene_type:complete
MSRPVIRAYTDYKSPYAFVALGPTLEFAARWNAELEWLPYTLRIAEYLDAVDTRSPHNWRKVRYAYMDARRYANLQGLTLKGPRRIYDGYYANAGMLFTQRAGGFDAYHRTVFEKFWKHELDVDSLDDIRAEIAAAGADADAFADYAEGPGREEQSRIVAEAEDAGIFGVPSFVHEGELFWGGDRIWMLEDRLRARAG